MPLSDKIAYLGYMKIKIFIAFFLSFFICFSALAETKAEFNKLRNDYVAALKNHDLAEEVYEKFKMVENPSAKILAYKGALEAIMTRTTWNFFKKLDYLRKSEQSFKESVSKAPNSIEVRFMRMAVQYDIPRYLGFSNDLNADKEFIIANIHNFNPVGLDDYTLNQIILFVKRCSQFSDNQVDRFEDILALNK